MDTVLEQNDYRVVILNPEDYELFHTARTLCWMDKTAAEVPRIESQKEAIRTHGSARYWHKIFYREPFDREFFVLLKDNAYGTSRIGGIVDLCFSDTQCPTVGTLHVMSPHRGRHLSDLLHRAARNFVLEYSEFKTMRCEIAEHNEPSRASAARNGFVSTRTFDDPERGRMFVYEKSLRYERGLINTYGRESVLPPESFTPC